MLNVISPYMTLVVPFLLLTAAWRFADWRNWRVYYPTIIFMIMIDLISSLLTYNHSLWYFHKALFLLNHTLRDFFINFTSFPAMVLIYLSRYPYKSSKLRQFAYITLWVTGFWLLEGGFLLAKKTTYFNGWNYGWSLVLWAVMFPVLRLHHTKPPWAWLICIGFTVFVISYFHLPITKLK